MQIFIIGAAGKVGSRLVPLLAKAGHRPVAMHRKPEQAASLEANGASPVIADLAALSADELGSIMRGSDAVVFSAGAGGALALT